MSPDLQSRLSRIQRSALVVGLISLGASAVGAFVNPSQFFFSYLFGYLFWLGLSLGCFAIAMIHQLTGGRWGYPTRRIFEAGFMVLPVMLVLLIPIFMGLGKLYPWARPEELATSEALRERQVYLNAWAFIARQVLFLLLWFWIAAAIRRCSLVQDTVVDAAPSRKARALSGPGLVIFGLVGTFAAVDWVMSLEAQWYSSIFAVILMGGQILSAFAFSIMAVTFGREHEPYAAVVNRTHFHQLGNLLLTFVLFWTYVSFSQLLIIYSGDLPHELEWYLHRISGGWRVVIGAVALFHFFLPFLLLLLRPLKRNHSALAVLAGTLFVMHLVDTYWLVMPSLHKSGLSISWMDFTAPIGIGGVWLAYFLLQLKSAPLLPRNDPGLQFSFVYAKP